MKPIIVLAMVAVASIALGSGFLGNDIDLWVQQFGTGSEEIVTPVSHAQIDFNIVKTVGNQGFFKNVITECLVTLDSTVGESHFMGQVNTLNNKLSEIQCKLSDSMGKIIAEGNTFSTFFPGGVVIVVPIDDPQLQNSQVQNVHDVHLVVKANTHQ